MILILISVNTAFAATNYVQKSRSLNFSGTTAYCDASVSQTGSEITLSAELWQGNTLIDYWDDMGTGSASISGSVSGCISGMRYKLKVYATVDGDPVSISSVTKICP